MQDEKRELPNMTATEVANADLPSFPTHGILADMVEREISLLKDLPQDEIPISEQANVPGGLLSIDPGTVPGKRPPNFGKKEYSQLPPLDGLVIRWARLTPAECLQLWAPRD